MAVTKRVRYEVLRRDGHKCRYCGSTSLDGPLTIDHVIPVALGGSDDPSNLVAACKDCNAGKTSTTPDAPMVTDVQQQALVWAAAMQLAAERRAEDEKYRRFCEEHFEAIWDEHRPHFFRSTDLPADWGRSRATWLNAGVTDRDLCELIPGVMGNRAVSDKWRYFCGCVWRIVRGLQASAQEIIEAADAS